MIIYIPLALLLICLATYYFYVLKPKKKLQWYKKTLQNLGYKVYVEDFAPFNSGFQQKMIKDEKEYNDPFYTAKKQYKNYDLALSNMLNQVMIEVIEPQLIKQLFSSKHVPNCPKAQILSRNLRRCVGKGIGFSQGKEWKKKRKIISTIFNFNLLVDNFPKIKELCVESFKKKQQECETTVSSDGQITHHYNIIQPFIQFASNVIIQCFFGSIATYQRIEGKTFAYFMHKLVCDAMAQSFDPLSMLLGPKFLDLGLREIDKDLNRRIKLFQQIGKTLIKKRVEMIEKGDDQGHDIISSLYRNKMMFLNKQDESEDKFSLDEMLIEFYNLQLAGSDTVSHYLNLMVLYIIQNPQVQQRLRKQIKEHIKDQSDINYEKLKDLTYIDWIQRQTTRMYGPGNSFLLRQASEDMYFENVPILKNTLLNYNSYGNSYNPKYYDEPEKFRPERWESQCQNLPSYAVVGFAGGPRSCLGKQLALLESKICLLRFFMRYQSIKLPKQDFKMCLAFFYSPQFMNIALQHKV